MRLNPFAVVCVLFATAAVCASYFVQLMVVGP